MTVISILRIVRMGRLIFSTAKVATATTTTAAVTTRKNATSEENCFGSR
jgi:hypothetical protein